MVPLLAALVYKIRPRISEVVGVVVATAGLGLMTLRGPIRVHRPGRPADSFVRRGFCGTYRDARPLFRAMRFEVLSVAQIGCGRGAGAGALLVGRDAPCRMAAGSSLGDSDHWFVCTALAFTIQAWAQQYTTSTRTALIYMLEPVVAWITSFLLVQARAFRRARRRVRPSSCAG